MTAVLALAGCGDETPAVTESPSTAATEPADALEAGQATLLPGDDRFGIYSLDLISQEVEELYSSPTEIFVLRLNSAGDRFAFYQEVSGTGNEFTEIFTLRVDGSGLQQLTSNDVWDIYPAWSPDGSQLAYLSWRDSNLDIYLMAADGSGQELLHDSGSHDADIHWVGDQIAFTSGSAIWVMREDGTEARQLTDPPRAGEWGNANLPFGDYDPRISPDGTQVVFERMVDDRSPHGNYDMYVVDIDGSNETRLTETGYAQGLASWSPAGDRIVYVVAVIGDVGQYDLYLMNADGTDNRNVTPSTFPPRFLCRWVIFGTDDTQLYFVGEWWSEE
jgi:TolB protein